MAAPQFLSKANLTGSRHRHCVLEVQLRNYGNKQSK